MPISCVLHALHGQDPDLQREEWACTHMQISSSLVRACRHTRQPSSSCIQRRCALTRYLSHGACMEIADGLHSQNHMQLYYRHCQSWRC